MTNKALSRKVKVINYFILGIYVIQVCGTLSRII